PHGGARPPRVQQPRGAPAPGPRLDRPDRGTAPRRGAGRRMTAAARHQERTALMGMAIFVASWAMLFAALFFAYGLSRLRAVSWPPGDLPPLPLLLPGLATLVLAGSSAVLHRGRVLAAVLLGGAFLGLQAVVWRQMFMAGLRPQAGAYASYFFALTVFHALHVLV